MPTKWIGFGEEDSDKVVAQEGQFVIHPSSGVQYSQHFLLVVD
jgi:hypothetical protein